MRGRRPAAMAESGESYVVEIETGVGDPRFVPLYVGTVLDPVSIGRRGDWRVDGNGVLDAHAYMYFDGQSLFLQSADERRPAMVEGRALGGAWTHVNAPCAIMLGSARLVFRARQAPSPRRSRPFEPGAFRRGSEDEEPTHMRPEASRVASHPPPMEERRTARNTQRTDPPTRVAAGINPRTGHIENMYDAPPGPRMSIGPPPKLNRGTTSKSPRARTRTETLGGWERLSGPGRILVLMSPFMVLAIYLLLRNGPSQARTPAEPADAGPVYGYTQPTAPPTRTVVPIVPPVTPPPTPPPDLGPPLTFSTKTLERTAIDLVASGQYEKAVQIYDLLAIANPANLAYREAARILRQKLDGG